MLNASFDQQNYVKAVKMGYSPHEGLSPISKHLAMTESPESSTPSGLPNMGYEDGSVVGI